MNNGEDDQEEYHVQITSEYLLLIGWGICDEIQRLCCTLAPAKVSEFDMLEADRVEFADRQYTRLICGHVLEIKVSSQPSEWAICPKTEILVT